MSGSTLRGGSEQPPSKAEYTRRLTSYLTTGNGGDREANMLADLASGNRELNEALSITGSTLVLQAASKDVKSQIESRMQRIFSRQFGLPGKLKSQGVG